ncbi:hypothetical protein [Streptomyces purpurascens]
MRLDSRPGHVPHQQPGQRGRRIREVGGLLELGEVRAHRGERIELR